MLETVSPSSVLRPGDVDLTVVGQRAVAQGVAAREIQLAAAIDRHGAAGDAAMRWRYRIGIGAEHQLARRSRRLMLPPVDRRRSSRH